MRPRRSSPGQWSTLPGLRRAGLGADRGAAGAIGCGAPGLECADSRLERLDGMSWCWPMARARFFLHPRADFFCIGEPTFPALGSRHFLHQAAWRGSFHGLQRGHALPAPHRRRR
ncbi:MAG: hypothetical protein ACK56I_09180, partial [bacterium]